MGGRCENATLLVRWIRINYTSYSILPQASVDIGRISVGCTTLKSYIESCTILVYLRRIYCEGYSRSAHLVCDTLKRI